MPACRGVGTCCLAFLADGTTFCPTQDEVKGAFTLAALHRLQPGVPAKREATEAGETRVSVQALPDSRMASLNDLNGLNGQ